MAKHRSWLVALGIVGVGIGAWMIVVRAGQGERADSVPPVVSVHATGEGSEPPAAGSASGAGLRPIESTDAPRDVDLTTGGLALKLVDGAGRVVAGARAELSIGEPRRPGGHGSDTIAILWSGTTDASGTCVADVATPWPIGLVATADGSGAVASIELTHLELRALRRGGRVERTVVLAPRHSVNVRAVDGDGAPVPGVLMCSAATDRFLPGHVRTGHLDGAATFDVLSEEPRFIPVVVTPRGATVAVPVSWAEAARGVALTVDPGVVVDVQVAGSAAETLWALEWEEAWEDENPEERLHVAADNAHRLDSARICFRGSATAVAGFPPGRCVEFHLVGEGRVVSRTVTLPAEPSRTSLSFDVDAGPPRRVTGRLVDAEGRPTGPRAVFGSFGAADAIELDEGKDLERVLRSHGRMIAASRDGRFSVTVPADSSMLGLGCGPFLAFPKPPYANSVALPPGSTAIDVGDVVLAEPPLWVAGAVVDSEGHPVPHARIRVTPIPSSYFMGALEVESDGEGRFAAYAHASFDAPEVEVLACVPDGASAGPMRLAVGAEDHVLRLAATATLRGSVQRDDPALKVEVRVAPRLEGGDRPPGQRERTIAVEEDGTFVVPGLAKGTYSVAVYAQGRQVGGVEDLLVTGPGEIREPRLDPVVVGGDLERLEVVVVSGGAPLEGATVIPFRTVEVLGHRLLAVVPSAATDAQGRAVLLTKPGAPMSLWIDAPGYFRRTLEEPAFPVRVDLDAGSSLTLRLRMAPGWSELPVWEKARLGLVQRDPHGEAVPWQRFDAGIQQFTWVPIGADGTATIRGITAGSLSTCLASIHDPPSISAPPQRMPAIWLPEVTVSGSDAIVEISLDEATSRAAFDIISAPR